MARLMARSPLEGAVVQHGGMRLAEYDPGRLTWIAPFPGSEREASRALEAALGLAFPAPGEVLENDPARLLWFGRAQAVLVGTAPPDLSGSAAVVDVSDGWAALSLTGAGAAAALARLTPLDLRYGAFPPGRTARSLLGHMTAQITRRAEGFEILVMRSMAGTAWHDIDRAMRSVAARG